MKRIEAIIFDWAGTTVDYGCMAPIYAMQQAFSHYHLAITLDEIRQPMGLLKIDHIKAILSMERVAALFNKIYGRLPEPKDIEQIYYQFEKNIFSILDQHTKLMPGVLTVQEYLRKQHIKIGSTTGYTKPMLDIVAKSAKQQGYTPDHTITADCVSHGRPYPYMLHHNLAALQLQDVRNIIKVGDTIVDILEGLHAGCWSVGVVKGSSLVGLDEQETAALPEEVLHQKMKQARKEMLAAGAHEVIDTLDELPRVIETIQQKLHAA